MAGKNVATLIIRIKDEATKGIKALGSAIQTMGRISMTVIAQIGLLGGAMVKLAERGSKAQEVEKAFRSMSASVGKDADQMLKKMRELSAGTVADTELMKQANQAMMLGLPVEKFGEMLAIARSSSKATGQSMEFMLQSIVTGLGRGSKMILDNLGIVFDINKAYDEYARTLGKTAAQLTEAEKKQAFINKAMAVGTANAKAQGETVDSMADAIARGRAKMQNLADTLGKRAIPAVRILLYDFERLTAAMDDPRSGQMFSKTMQMLVKIMMGLKFFVDEAANAISLVLAPSIGFIAEAIKGNFAKAWTLAKTTANANLSEMKASYERFNEDLKRIDKEFAEDAKQRSMELRKAKMAGFVGPMPLPEEMEAGGDAEGAQAQREIEEERKKQENLRLVKQEARQLNAEDQMIADQEDLLRQQEKADIETQIHEVRELQKAQATAQRAAMEIKDEQKRSKALDTIRKNDNKLDEKMQLLKWQRAQAVNDHMVSLTSNLVALTKGKNKELLALQKAAGIASVIINTQIALAKVASQTGIFAAIATPLIYANMAAQIALISSQKLADGGIVKASPGGTLATIGEGGKDEAVIPLDSQAASERLGGGGGSITINVGAFVGDAATARQFAVFIDEELLKLRRSNESVSFDEGLA